MLLLAYIQQISRCACLWVQRYKWMIPFVYQVQGDGGSHTKWMNMTSGLQFYCIMCYNCSLEFHVLKLSQCRDGFAFQRTIHMKQWCKVWVHDRLDVVYNGEGSKFNATMESGVVRVFTWLTRLKPCHSRWNIGHRPLFSIFISVLRCRLRLPPGSSCTCKKISFQMFFSSMAMRHPTECLFDNDVIASLMYNRPSQVRTFSNSVILFLDNYVYYCGCHCGYC